jgi:hypothetical protein
LLRNAGEVTLHEAVRIVGTITTKTLAGRIPDRVRFHSLRQADDSAVRWRYRRVRFKMHGAEAFGSKLVFPGVDWEKTTGEIKVQLWSRRSRRYVQSVSGVVVSSI